jgi:hypothetical protein
VSRALVCVWVYGSADGPEVVMMRSSELMSWQRPRTFLVIHRLLGDWIVIFDLDLSIMSLELVSVLVPIELEPMILPLLLKPSVIIRQLTMM